MVPFQCSSYKMKRAGRQVGHFVKSGQERAPFIENKLRICEKVIILLSRYMYMQYVILLFVVLITGIPGYKHLN